MSKFKTSIAVDVESIIKLLPAGAFLHGVEFDKATNSVNVQWEHDVFVSGRDYPVEFPRLNLEQQRKPDGVNIVPPKNLVLPMPEKDSEPGGPETGTTELPPATTGGGPQTETVAPESGTIPAQTETVVPQTETVAPPTALSRDAATPPGAVPTAKAEPVAKPTKRR